MLTFKIQFNRSDGIEFKEKNIKKIECLNRSMKSTKYRIFKYVRFPIVKYETWNETYQRFIFNLVG